MKNFLLLTYCVAFSFAVNAQTNVLCEDWNTYSPDTSAAFAHYHGWYISYHGTNSFYTSSGSSGISGPNSYKFGADSATLITPDISGADHINFWMRGNGTDSSCVLYVYESADSVQWALVATLDTISHDTAVVEFPISPGTRFVKFFYDKSLGNVAFDDFCATIGAVSSVRENSLPMAVLFYPNPSAGQIHIEVNNAIGTAAELIITGSSGKMVKRLALCGVGGHFEADLSDLEKGNYIASVRNGNRTSSQRLSILY
jgi:hypothetical protein